MDGPSRSPDQEVRAWTCREGADYTPAGRLLPVAEESITQVGPGAHEIHAEVVSAGEVAVIRVRTRPLAVGVTILLPSHVGFILPVSWRGELRVNGESASTSSLYTSGEGDGLFLRGEEREVLGIGVPRDRLIATIAALRGVGPEDVRLQDRVLPLPRAAAERMRTRLLGLMRQAMGCGATTPRLTARLVAAAVEELVIDAHSCPRSTASRAPGPGLPSERIVCLAEERFAAAEGRPVSLADLCAAAGVSKSALYRAFHATVGEAPLAYFHARRLMQARSRLLASPVERGAVKRAALDAGLLALGRFSVEYRRLFGESPSATLSRSTG